ncbi:hypothetical protein [Chitinolyticbacter meiyuanensis]|uniref:hypothetical protein n=1 Tax=Chitinolyticbacter meiyuanensis TaxID=682798 RepID=UPI0011E5EE1A|nr:hypothetical protein [Chitinolyticbacter meiyuanensis]
MLYCTFNFPDEPEACYLSAWGGKHRQRHHVAIYDQRSGDIVARFALDGIDVPQQELELIHRRAIAQFRRHRAATCAEHYQELDRRGPAWRGDIIHL